ncbi:MAG: ABC transporter substrate-binding protein [Bacteroidota bacterium]
MRRIFPFLLLLTVSLFGWSRQQSAITYDLTAPPRVISLSGAITDVLVTLGQADALVGRDVTSTYPAETTAEIPSLGHVSQLNAEAILALRPEIIFVEADQAKQSSVLDQLSGSSVKVVPIQTEYSLANAGKIAEQLQAHMPIAPERVAALLQQNENTQARLQKTLSNVKESPKVLFIYARGAGRLLVAGTETSASTVIDLAGGTNAIQSFTGFKALNSEALIEARPDVILMFTSGLASLDGKKGLAQIPGMLQTPAFQQNRIIAMDGHYLTGFGTQAGQAVEELARNIHQIP